MSAMNDEVTMRVVAGLLCVLIGLVAWIGKRLHDKMDTLSDQLSDHRLETERRITRLESDMNSIGDRLKHIETALER